jgi:DMSO reductase anchor subunit
MLKEWPLVAFTILGQAAVGLFVIGAMPFLLIYDAAGSDPSAFLALLTSVFGLLAVAALVSFLHLRHPLKAVRSVANFRTSWLSREIFFELLFMAVIAIEAVLVRTGAALALVRIVHISAALTGLLFLLSMIGIYMLESLPFWDQAATPLSFVATSLALGVLAAAGITGVSKLYILAGALVLVDLAIALAYAPGHGWLVRRAPAAIRPPAMLSRRLHGAGLGLETIGLGLLAWAVLKRPDLLEGPGIWAAAILGLILSAQIVRRFLFYGLAGHSGR